VTIADERSQTPDWQKITYAAQTYPGLLEEYRGSASLLLSVAINRWPDLDIMEVNGPLMALALRHTRVLAAGHPGSLPGRVMPLQAGALALASHLGVIWLRQALVEYPAYTASPALPEAVDQIITTVWSSSAGHARLVSACMEVHRNLASLDLEDGDVPPQLIRVLRTLRSFSGASAQSVHGRLCDETVRAVLGVDRGVALGLILGRMIH
jgi:hypothetical protein